MCPPGRAEQRRPALCPDDTKRGKRAGMSLQHCTVTARRREGPDRGPTEAQAAVLRTSSARARHGAKNAEFFQFTQVCACMCVRARVITRVCLCACVRTRSLAPGFASLSCAVTQQRAHEANPADMLTNARRRLRPAEAWCGVALRCVELRRSGRPGLPTQRRTLDALSARTAAPERRSRPHT